MQKGKDMKDIDHIIEEALKTEPTFKLRKDFKDKVVQAIRKKERASHRRLYMWMTLGTLIILGFGYGTISYFLPSLLDSFGNPTSGMDRVIPMAILVGIVVILVQYLDKYLVQKRFLQHN